MPFNQNEKGFFSPAQLLNTAVTLLIIVISFAILVFLGVFIFDKVYQIKNLNNDLTTMKATHDLLINDIKSLEEEVIERCEESNTFKKYLFIESENCTLTLLSHNFQNLETLNLERDFLFLVESFFIEPEDNQELMEIFLTDNNEKFENRSDDAFLEITQQFNALIANEDVQKYLTDYNIQFIINNNEIVLKNETDHLATIFLDKKYKNLKAYLPQHDSTVQADNITAKIWEVKQTQETLSQTQMELLVEKLELLESDDIQRENVLLLGKSGGNVDTIMLASIDHTNEKITLISLPRDLWVNSRKINSLYIYYGMEYFMNKISTLTGQHVEKYVLIDMLAFPKVIDAIGGIDYTFEKPLIDSSYRTVDDGIEGTLYFETGTHHLNGIQALRVARTRKTSSDFARADRQQTIMLELKNKALTLKNPTSIMDLSTILFEHVNTNIEPSEALQLFSRAKNYSMNTGNVMSTGNILRSQMLELSSGRKAYILLPYNENWALIKQYVWQRITE